MQKHITKIKNRKTKTQAYTEMDVSENAAWWCKRTESDVGAREQINSLKQLSVFLMKDYMT